jgi:hypothetical protein
VSLENPSLKKENKRREIRQLSLEDLLLFFSLQVYFKKLTNWSPQKQSHTHKSSSDYHN